ncbi:molybdate ABC transporter substrate-binding protein [Pantoea sp. Bo_2]|uniref:Molybdate ABC transporter substrate-binding protein n=1 Tax=Candidatus Pantoea gossypiicola TaxID=2608008 RepID=A0AB34CMP0_9GAMM|nr:MULTISPECIES: molybdate ABC transporter substrate-binding protein [Pantoea]KAA5931718.1 molybdate ABC transporter substrate-binding protein [Pantoea sp. VH_8]KAA5936853.1 molybdate ABC transporter substrate-binding protein [Pantoea sp. VH_4]KAA5948400.1 molybdate ABC transporter substrate-binding protein [Pantoea sp. VH_3]KAA5953670.1 molybdate ABC transporter substrate-binding protein [Pantoea sp. VH_25]KAA5956688.1 molybdate ABC transporter substrate-binding protein [Pantoea sp. VH_24]
MQVLAAGSLKGVWPALMAYFPEPVETHFGPAGLLRERIEAGESCDLFASASEDHPQTLLAAGHALSVMPFTSNRLCITVRSDCLLPGDDWFTLLTRDTLRIATSTPGTDPSGDYTQVLFSRMGNAGEAVRQRALPLVGGRDSPAIPAGRLAAEWIIQADMADLFIGYASYRAALSRAARLTVVDIPVAVNPVARYACAVITPEAQRLATFLGSEQAKAVLRDAGFGCE